MFHGNLKEVTPLYKLNMVSLERYHSDSTRVSAEGEAEAFVAMKIFCLFYNYLFFL